MLPLEVKIVEDAAAKATAKIAEAAADESLDWEEVSRIAGEENLKLLQIMDAAEGTANDIVEANTDQAIAAGIFMFEKAKGTVDSEYIPDLVAGVNALVARVRQQAEAGRIIPMDYMDPATRKQIFLVESYMRSGE